LEEVEIMHSFESIRMQAEAILGEMENWRRTLIRTINPSGIFEIRGILEQKIIEAKRIIDEYNSHYYRAANVLNIGLQPVTIVESSEGAILGSLRQTIVRCDSVVGFVRDTISPISPQEADRLQSLRGQLGRISADIPEIDSITKNIEEAVREYEKGHFLASTLVISRVIVYILSRLEGKTDDERIRLLVSSGVIPKDREDIHTFILKTCRKARNYLSHDIRVFPDSSDSLSLLGDSVTLLNYFILYTKSLGRS